MTDTQDKRISGLEVRSIDYVPETERHGKVWQQGPFWFLGNFQFFSIAIGFIGLAALLGSMILAWIAEGRGFRRPRAARPS